MDSMGPQRKYINPGDIKSLVNWLDDPKNHHGAVDAISFAPEQRKQDAFIDFIATSPEFQGWDRGMVAQAVDKANEMDLMETKSFMFEARLRSAASKGIKEALKEVSSPSKKKLVKKTISRSQLAEGVKKALRLALKENSFGLMDADVVGWHSDEDYNICRKCIDDKTARRKGMTPISKDQEGWEMIQCDICHDHLGKTIVPGLPEERGRGMAGTQMPKIASAAGDDVPGIDETRHGSMSGGKMPSDEDFQASWDEAGGFDMKPQGEMSIVMDIAAKLSPEGHLGDWTTPEGFKQVVQMLYNVPDPSDVFESDPESYSHIEPALRAYDERYGQKDEWLGQSIPDKAYSIASEMLDALGWEWV